MRPAYFLLPFFALPAAATTLLPRVDAGARVAHDFGLSPLRGTIELGIDLTLVATATWQLDVWFGIESFVRYNQPPESPIRISPQQVHYPVGARYRRWLDPDHAWGLFAFHQSNHDIDTTDATLNQETVSYEVYGAEWLMPYLHLHGGLYWDRGTRLNGYAQEIPFDYMLFGVTAETEVPFYDPWYTAARLEAITHRDADHDPAHLSLEGHLDLGARFVGERGTLRVFLRGQRIENYRFLGDDPRHLLLLGTGLSTR